MAHIVGDHVRLPAGTAVLIVGFTANAPFRPQTFCDSIPAIVFAGKLLEPYTPGQGILLAPGPMAGSVSPKGCTQVSCRAADGAAFISLRHRHHDARGAYFYLVMEDEFNTAGRIEIARLASPIAWEDYLRFAVEIKTRVRRVWSRLDCFNRADLEQ